ncbi:helix-turn-helix domain-containing protein [Kitasatospora aureofaciens]|uniref:helix-turn-helix domain-containing protein n=1 Tax=Kitasatospora aureofaciens TaxID=1894 RepID=UPI001C454B02|nr:helix-turn-helix domain-containing protein [Kitasatospora aureofaciens]MBV6697493.1 helix-turn-helix domain-containing protein [Kitasatospora aureofaciens]
MPAKTGTPAPAGFMWIDEAALALGVQVSTLYKWRYRGIGPTPVRHAGRLMYAKTTIEDYLRALVAAAQPAPRRALRPAVAA